MIFDTRVNYVYTVVMLATCLLKDELALLKKEVDYYVRK